jgi:hypothetical protein
MPSVEKHVAYKPTTIYRNLLSVEERQLKKLCTVWPEEITLPHQAFGTHARIPGRPREDDPPQADAFYVPEGGGEPKLTNRYGFTRAPAGVERQDMGHVVTLAMLGISSRRVAMDVLGLSDAGIEEVHGNKVLCPPTSDSELFQKGYFVPVEEHPTEAELEAAEDRREAYLDKALIKGDNIWNQTQRFDRIPPEAIIAARFRGEERPWAPSVAGRKRKKTVACPACGSTIVYGVKLCVSCQKWLGYEQDGTVYAQDDPERKARIVAEKLKGKKSAPEADETVGA